MSRIPGPHKADRGSELQALLSEVASATSLREGECHGIFFLIEKDYVLLGPFCLLKCQLIILRMTNNLDQNYLGELLLNLYVDAKMGIYIP